MHPRRLLLLLAVAAVVAATALLGDPAEDSPGAGGTTAPAQPETSAPPVDDLSFCEAFATLGAVAANHSANDSRVSRTELDAASQAVRDLAPRLAVDDATRAGLLAEVEALADDGVADPGESTAADAEQQAFAEYLGTACQTGTESEPL
ncbi:hypothetical protein [Nocardioides nanhaiensis]|uniref:DUF732 domain-containing protein n=1 Tax=Nocardioides nanhaiensis TaxID=1476871 RepID=A0ABP8WFT6_9ACTN